MGGRRLAVRLSAVRLTLARRSEDAGRSGVNCGLRSVDGLGNKNSQDVSWHTHVTTLMARTLAIAQDNLGAESRGADENSVIQS